MTAKTRKTTPWAALLIAATVAGPAAAAAPQYDDGANNTEIRIGTIVYNNTPLVNAFVSYFKSVNDQGGVNGRKINLIVVEADGKADHSAELARKLVEEEHVLALFATMGIDDNLAIRAYANGVGIPQLFVLPSTQAFDDPAHYRWTMNFLPPDEAVAAALADYTLDERRHPKIAILRDDSVRAAGYADAYRKALGDKATKLVVKDIVHPATASLVDLPIQELKDSGADVFLNLIWRSGGASSAALKAHDIGWRPLQLVPSGAMVGRFFRNQDEFKEASGLVVTVWMPFWNPRWTSGIYGDKRTMTFERSPVPTYLQWMTKYNPDADPNDGFYVTGANMSQALVRVLRNCGDELTRANVLKQASHIDEQLSMMLQYTPITTSPNDYQPVKQFFLGKTNEHGWYRVKTVNTK